MRFKDKIVLVTGSSRGIGKAIALGFAKEGATLIINCNNSIEEGNETLNEIQKISSKSILIQCDVSDETKIMEMFKEIVNTFGQLDILVNNAGIVYDVPFLEKTSKEWRRTLDVNLLGPVFCCKEFARLSKKNKNGGAIVNISSTNGINCFHPDSMDYDISKAGVIMLTNDLAIELAPIVRVNCVAPGWVDTEMNKDLPKDFVEKETERIYMKRFAKPQEIAKIVLFLASDEASFITGETIKVDGGYGGWIE